jgi:hypothetical protein
MSRLPTEPAPELTTTRTGGRSARLIALGIAVVLVGAVYVGFSGKTTPPSGPSPVPPIAGASSSPGQSLAAAASFPIIAGVVENPGAVDKYVYLGLSLVIGGAQAITPLEVAESNHFHATYRVALPPPSDKAKLELVQVLRDDQGFVRYGTWPLSLDVFDPNASPFAILLNELRQPDRFATSPDLVRNGYRILVGGERVDGGGTINVDITVGANPSYPSGEYTVVAQTRQSASEVSPVEEAPGRLSGQIVFPDNVHASTAALLLRGFDRARFLFGEHLADLVIALPDKSKFVPGAAAFNIAFDPDPLAPNRMGIVNAGFQFDGTYELVNGKRAVSFLIRLNRLYDPLFLGGSS